MRINLNFASGVDFECKFNLVGNFKVRRFNRFAAGWMEWVGHQLISPGAAHMGQWIGPALVQIMIFVAYSTPSHYLNQCWVIVNTLRPRQNGRRFADDTFKRIFLNGNVRISIKNSLKFVPRGPINNIPALVQKMAWHQSGDKPLSEPMMASLLTHKCVTRPQWVNWILRNFNDILIKIHNLSFTKMHLKGSSAKWRPFCSRVDKLNVFCVFHI